MPRPEADPRRPLVWHWRPAPWTRAPEPQDGPLPAGERIALDVTLFHDAARAEIGVGDAACGLSLEIASFDGSYLSLACDLPDAALPLMTPARLFEAGTEFRAEPATAAWLRLNLQRGPELLQPVSRLAPEAGAAHAAFDLGTLPGRAAVSRAWVELIFDCAGPCRIEVPDLAFWLSPRAEI